MNLKDYLEPKRRGYTAQHDNFIVQHVDSIGIHQITKSDWLTITHDFNSVFQNQNRTSKNIKNHYFNIHKANQIKGPLAPYEEEQFLSLIKKFGKKYRSI
jgi:predicted aldo/keto reductase-like oxidoreductase